MKSTGSITANPNPVRARAPGATTLSWSSTGTTNVEVRVGAPDGPLFSRTGPSGTAATGKWVWNGTLFYLQDVSGGLPLTSKSTIATVRIDLVPSESFLSAMTRILRSHISAHHKLLWFGLQIQKALFMFGGRNRRHSSSWRRLVHRDAWLKGLPDELEYWDECIAGSHSDSVRDLVDESRALQEPLVVARIHGIPGEHVSILDVGAGPITRLGYKYPGKVISITALDALGVEYRGLLKRAGLIPPFPTKTCRGEDLTRVFQPETFDFACARNSLDHSFDPVRIIRQMLAVIRKGGFVILRHHVNEGRRQHYRGLHQWNFAARQGELVIWDETAEYNVTQLLQAEATIEWHIEALGEGQEWISCVLTKQS